MSSGPRRLKRRAAGLNPSQILRDPERVYIDPVRGCHIWLGCLDDKGYGRIRWQGGNRRVHRIAYEQFVGVRLHPKQTLHHACTNRACCSVQHLRLVTTRHNVLAGKVNGNDERLVCIRGHVMRGSNLYIRPNQDRSCKLCKAAYAKSRVKGGLLYGSTVEYALEYMVHLPEYAQMFRDARGIDTDTPV